MQSNNLYITRSIRPRFSHLPYIIELLSIQVAELASLAQLLPPCSPTVRNPAPDSCASPRLRPLQLLFAACFRFSCCSRARLRHWLPLLLPWPFASASSCCSPIAPASAAARRLRLLQLLLPIASALAATPRLPTAAPRLRPLQLLLADCIRFNCCSPIASASTAARSIASASTATPRLHTSACWIPDSSRSSRFSK